MASLFPCPESERGEKGSKRDGEKNEEEKETGGRKKKKAEKNEQLELVKGREEGRALHHRACRPFRRGVWLRDIKMC